MLTLAKKLFSFKEPVLLLLFRVEEVVSDASEEGLSIGYRFKHKRFILGFQLREVALHLLQEPAGEQRPAST